MIWNEFSRVAHSKPFEHSIDRWCVLDAIENRIEYKLFEHKLALFGSISTTIRNSSRWRLMKNFCFGFQSKKKKWASFRQKKVPRKLFLLFDCYFASCRSSPPVALLRPPRDCTVWAFPAHSRRQKWRRWPTTQSRSQSRTRDGRREAADGCTWQVNTKAEWKWALRERVRVARQLCRDPAQITTSHLEIKI